MARSRLITRLAHVSSLDGKEAQGLFDARLLSSRDKSTMALKRLAIFWGIAILWIPVPMLHFVMIPVFLLIGIVAFAHAFTVRQTIESARGICPSCQKPFELGRLRWRERIKERCPHCRQELYVRLDGSEVEAGAYAALEERIRAGHDGHSGHELQEHT